jgi:hypothetical protein
MKISKAAANFACTLLCGLSLTFTAKAAQLFVNGGFENGNLSGWSTAASANGTNTLELLPNSTIQAPDGDPTDGANSGNWYGVIDEFGSNDGNAESIAIWQTVSNPSEGDVFVLSLAMAVYDGTGGSGLGAEVGIWAGNANPLTDAPLVIFAFADTAAASPGVPNPYVFLSQNITADMLLAGPTVLIGIFESDALGPITVSIDDFSLTAVPEPGTVWLVGLLMAGMLFYLARRNARA